MALWTLRLNVELSKVEGGVISQEKDNRAYVELLGCVRCARPRVSERRARWEFTYSAGQGGAGYRVPQRTRPSLDVASSVV